MSSPASRSDPPAPLLRMLEARALFEFGSTVAAAPLLRLVGRGDGHPVLVLPGFLAGDRATAPMRRILAGQGHQVHGWGLGRNLGPTDEIVEALTARLHDLHSRHGRPVSLVGWSLGGIFARRLARRFPGEVRQVITLGSPFRFEPGSRSTLSTVYRRLHDRNGATQVDARPDIAPLDVPTTSIYTRTDGIVRWWQCLEPVGVHPDNPAIENVEIRGSHTGLPVNPAAIVVIGDRLAQRCGHWRPFRPPPGTAMLFPHPADHDDDRSATGHPQSSTEQHTTGR